MDKKKVLVIEDERDHCLILKLNLEKTGKYEVFTAADGEEGLRKAREIKPHVVILDLRLPKLQGEEVCKHIRRDKEIGTTPIIMVTAKSSDADRIIGKVIGADSYICKPFEKNELLKEIDKVLNK